MGVPVTTANTGSTLSPSRRFRCEQRQCRSEQALGQLEAAHARVEQARPTTTRLRHDLERYAPLVEKDVISKQQFDTAVAAAASTKAALADAKASELAAEQGVRIARTAVAAGPISVEDSGNGTSANCHSAS